MKLDRNFALIHAYLCADGYVIKNPLTQKQKYYRIGLRNTNLILLKDFQEKFEKVFGVKPRLVEGQRCEIGSRELYELLTKEFGSFYSWKWSMPSLKDELLSFWLRSFFDCEGWVYIKSHQNRQIGLDCVNEKGINQIRDALTRLGIHTIKKLKKNGKIFRIFIFGKENLLRFKEKVGFFHPEKAQKLNLALADYVVYKWIFPKNEKQCKKFVKKILKEKIRIKDKKHIRIISNERENLNKLNCLLFKFFKLKGLSYKRINGLGTEYYELHINKREDIERLIKEKIIQNLFKNV